MPKEFGYPFDGDIPYTHSESGQTDIWLPAGYTVHQKTARADNFESADAAIGRLRNGVSASEAQGELAAIESHLDPLYPEMWRGSTALVRSLVRTILGPVETTLWLLFGAVLVVLLIAISNMASLLLARATTRTHEMGIRTALGAERGRIIRQLLTESVLLSCMGGVLGIGLAYAAVPLLIHLSPAGIPRLETASVDGRVLLLAVLLSLATGVLSGLAPITVASRVSVNDLLKGGGNRGAIGGSHRGRSALIVFEVALSVVLLAGAGLLIRSYLELERVNTGFSRAALTFRLTLDDRYNKPELRTTLYKRFLQKLQSIPGVTYAGASNAVPPLGNGETVTFVDIRGFGKSKEMVENRSVTRDYRKALGTPLLRGRDFSADDLTSKTPVVMVNQKFVDTYFKGHDPFRQQVRIGIGDMFSPWSTVVGVVGDVRHNKLEEAGQPQIFQPVDNGDNFAVKYSTTAAHVAEQARTALRSLDPALTLDNIRTMSERIDESNARRRFETTLLTGFGGIAIGLALIGLYGLMSYTVKERAAEIGIRVTLGSSRNQVVGLVLRQGLRLTTAGLALGLGGAFALTPLVNGWVFGVKATDPMTFLAVPLFVLVVTCFACLIPAWSAARIDPVETLRQQ